jgi:hypothetical protein
METLLPKTSMPALCSKSWKNSYKQSIATLSIAASAVFMPTIGGFGLFFAATPAAQAQSEASLAVSMLPLASVVVTGVGASTAAGASVAAPVILLTAGSVLVIKTIEVTARGTVYVLERASDGARVSVEILGKSVQYTAASIGATVTVSVIGSGVVLSALGEAIAFIPNELGRALLHNERVTR